MRVSVAAAVLLSIVPVFALGQENGDAVGGTKPVDITVIPAGIEEDTESDAAFRVWHDETGMFSVRAKLLGIRGQEVKLATDDGRDIDVPLSRLCLADREFCEQVRQKSERDRIRELLAEEIAGYEELMLELRDSDTNSVAREQRSRRRWDATVDRLRGKSLSVCFHVEDIVDESHRTMQIIVSQCDIRASVTPEAITMHEDPELVRRIKKGSVIQVDGVIFKDSSRAFTRYDLEYRVPSSRLGYTTGLPIAVYVHDIRVLDDVQAKAWLANQGGG